MRKLAAMLMGLTAALWAEGAAADARDLEIFHSIAINAPADEVWAMAGDFGGILELADVPAQTDEPV